MNQHLKNADNFYKSNGKDFKEILGRYLCDGFVLCLDDVFAIGFYSKSSEPTVPCDSKNADTIFVTYCSGKISIIAKTLIGSIKYGAFQRDIRGSSKIRLIPLIKFIK